MVFEVLRDSEDELCFATAARARRGRAVLYALAPWVLCLLGLSVLFGLELANLTSPGRAIRAALVGSCAAAFATPFAYALGYRAREQVEASRTSIRILRRPAWGPSELTAISVRELTGFGIDPSIRSLGADLHLVAVHRDGRRIGLVEGDPHLGQLRQLGARVAQISRLPLEGPRFEIRSQPQQ